MRKDRVINKEDKNAGISVCCSKCGSKNIKQDYSGIYPAYECTKCGFYDVVQ